MSEQPKRIQRKRTKGWRMPPNTVYVGRPSKWGNPFVASKDGQPHHDKLGFHTLASSMALQAFRSQLKESGQWSSIPPHKWPRRNGHLLIPREWTTIEDVKRG